MPTWKGGSNEGKHLGIVVSIKSRVQRKNEHRRLLVRTGTLLQKRKRDGPIVLLLFLSLVSTSLVYAPLLFYFFLLLPRDSRGGLLTPSTNARWSKYQRFLRSLCYFSRSPLCKLFHPPLGIFSPSTFQRVSPLFDPHYLRVGPSTSHFLNQRNDNNHAISESWIMNKIILRRI